MFTHIIDAHYVLYIFELAFYYGYGMANYYSAGYAFVSSSALGLVVPCIWNSRTNWNIFALFHRVRLERHLWRLQWNITKYIR